MSRRLAAWVPAIAWAALLFFLSSRESLPAPRLPHFDKVAHFGAYLVLGALLALAADRSRLPLWVAILLGIAYGASDEVHQMFVPGRTSSLGDLAADAAGVLVAVLCYARGRARRTPPPLRRRAEPTAFRT